MAQSNNILSFNATGNRAALSDKAERAVEECRKITIRVLPKLMNGLFEKLDDALYELADKSDSNKLQTAYFDAMRILRSFEEGENLVLEIMRDKRSRTLEVEIPDDRHSQLFLPGNELRPAVAPTPPKAKAPRPVERT